MNNITHSTRSRRSTLRPTKRKGWSRIINKKRDYRSEPTDLKAYERSLIKRQLAARSPLLSIYSGIPTLTQQIGRINRLGREYEGEGFTALQRIPGLDSIHGFNAPSRAEQMERIARLMAEMEAADDIPNALPRTTRRRRSRCNLAEGWCSVMGGKSKRRTMRCK